MAKETGVGFQVGLFVLLALAGLTAFVFSVSDSSVFERGKTMKLIFGFSNGVKHGAPVRIAGVDQGMVKDLRLFIDPKDGRTKVEISLWLKKDSRVPVDSVAKINQLGLLGEKYIEITPGLDTSHYYQEGEFFHGKDPVPQEAISERVMAVAGKVEDTVEGIRQIVRNEKNQEAITLALTNINGMAGNFNGLIADLRHGKGTASRLIYDPELYEDMTGLFGDLRANPWKLLYRPK
ncbi:MAG: MCE family protein [Candidatus Omnitrophica bacterium]|nr:MCE family protein [Candidatus Omnitrophota bacterium]